MSMIKIRRRRNNAAGGRSRVLRKKKKKQPRKRRDTDPPRSGLWHPGGAPSPQPLRSLRQRYFGTGKHLIVKRRIDEDGEVVLEPIETVFVGGRGHVEVRSE